MKKLIIALLLFFTAIHAMAPDSDKASKELFFAASIGDAFFIRDMIIKDGANINYIDPKSDKTALEIAKEKGHKNVVSEIRKIMAEQKTTPKVTKEERAKQIAAEEEAKRKRLALAAIANEKRLAEEKAKRTKAKGKKILTTKEEQQRIAKEDALKLKRISDLKTRKKIKSNVKPTKYSYYTVPQQAGADCGLEALLNTAEILKRKPKPGASLVIKTSDKRIKQLQSLRDFLTKCNLETNNLTYDEILKIMPMIQVEEGKLIVIPNLDKFSLTQYSTDRINHIITAIQNLQRSQKAKYGFTIGTMSVSQGSLKGIGGHWISVVVDKQGPDNIIFYIADSSGNPRGYQYLIDKLIRILNMNPEEMLMEIEIGPLVTIAEAKAGVGKFDLALYALANVIAKTEANKLWNNAQFIRKYRNKIGTLINFSLEASGKAKININQSAKQVLNNLANALKMQTDHLKIAYVAEATLDTLDNQMKKGQFKEAWQNIQQNIIPNGLLYIGVLLLSRNIDAEVLNLADKSWDECKNIIRGKNPDIVGISCYTFNRHTCINREVSRCYRA